MKNSQDQNKTNLKKIKELESLISHLNDSLDYWIDNFSNLTTNEQSRLLVKLENCYLNIHSTHEFISYKISKPRRKVRVIRIDEDDHLVIKCSRKTQNQVIKEEITFDLTCEVV